MSKIIKIGLCGRSGSGKGYISETLEKFGLFIIDTDKVYQNIVSTKENNECKNELLKQFGNCIFNEDGSVNKKELGKIVFKVGNEDLLKKLNKIAHKYVKIECDKIIEKIDSSKYMGVIIDAPLLFESGFDKFCDKTCCIISNEDVRIKRIIERDNISEEEAKKRLRNQLSDDELKKKCDFVIINNDNPEITSKGISELLACCQNKLK